MAITVIPFNMPEPMEIPSHLVEQLKSMPADAAVSRAMELLMQIEAADHMVYERVDADGNLQLVEACGKNGPDASLLEALSADGLHGTSIADSTSTLAGQAFGQGSSLLIMGQHDDNKTSPLPPALLTFLLGDSGVGNVCAHLRRRRSSARGADADSPSVGRAAESRAAESDTGGAAAACRDSCGGVNRNAIKKEAPSPSGEGASCRSAGLS